MNLDDYRLKRALIPPTPNTIGKKQHLFGTIRKNVAFPSFGIICHDESLLAVVKDRRRF